MKVEGNGIIGRAMEMVMSIYRNLDYGERQGKEESSHSKISRQAEWEKHGIKNGLEDDNFDLCRGHDVSKAIILN